jgi:hypothetical protein
VLTSSINVVIAPASTLPSTCAVVLRLLADHGDRKTGLERHRGDQQHRRTLGGAEQLRAWREQTRDGVCDIAQQIRSRQEPELVEVDRRRASRRQDELAVQLGCLDHALHQVIGHGG